MYRFRRKCSYLFTLFCLTVNEIHAENPLQHLCLGIKTTVCARKTSKIFEKGVSGSKSLPEVEFDSSKVTQKFIFIQLIINILVFPRAPIPADHILLMGKL